MSYNDLKQSMRIYWTMIYSMNSSYVGDDVWFHVAWGEVIAKPCDVCKQCENMKNTLRLPYV